MPKPIFALALCCAALLAACQTATPTKPAQTPLASATFAQGWDGEPVAGAPTVALSVQGDHLVLCGSRQAEPQILAIDQPLHFMPGLWDGDCAEAFLLNPDNGHYLELNLSPTGAWWACLFRGPRERATPEGLPLPGVVCDAKGSGHAWSAELRIPLASLPPELAFAPGRTRANLCFCLDPAPKQHYLSWCDLGGGTPNFHQPRHWRTIPAK